MLYIFFYRYDYDEVKFGRYCLYESTYMRPIEALGHGYRIGASCMSFTDDSGFDSFSFRPSSKVWPIRSTICVSTLAARIAVGKEKDPIIFNHEMWIENWK